MAKYKVLNHNLWEVFAESVDSRSFKKYRQAMQQMQPVHFEDYYEPLDRWYEISAYPAARGLSVYFKDITERKLSLLRLNEMNESLSRQKKELELSNAELEQFAYVASHDLQEPLRMVTSFLTQLERKYGDVVDEKGKQYIFFAVDGAKRMRQIILDLLEFSRVGKIAAKLEDVNLANVIDEVRILYRKKIEEAHVVINVGELPVVRISKSGIRQVFQNLIGNAIKYGRRGVAPVIDISCKESQYQWIFSVSDNGIGIDEAYFDKIFIIFQRLHNKEQYSGTGMGLAIAKKIIEHMDGNIWVTSQPDAGSTFYFTILKQQQ